jgi:hypothetical protein
MTAYAQYFFVNNQFKIWWTQSIVTKDYDPELGFVSRNDVVATTPGFFGGIVENICLSKNGYVHGNRVFFLNSTIKPLQEN